MLDEKKYRYKVEIVGMEEDFSTSIDAYFNVLPESDTVTLQICSDTCNTNNAYDDNKADLVRKVCMLLEEDNVDEAKRFIEHFSNMARMDRNNENLRHVIREMKREFSIYRQKQQRRSKPPTAKQTFGGHRKRRYFSG